MKGNEKKLDLGWLQWGHGSSCNGAMDPVTLELPVVTVQCPHTDNSPGMAGDRSEFKGSSTASVAADEM